MTDERAKEIAEEIRAQYGTDIAHAEPRDQLLLHLYDDIQSIKASMGGLAFLNSGIQPVRRVEE